MCILSEITNTFLAKDSLTLLLTLGLFGYYNNILRNLNGIDHTVKYLNSKGVAPWKLPIVIPLILGFLINPGGIILSLEAVEHLPANVPKILKGGACMFFRHIFYPIL